jgi:hypothetical protein
MIKQVVLKVALLAVACLFATLGYAQPVRAAATITLDGHFDDWQGQMSITDPAGDSYSRAADIVGFYWANNPDDETCYWMIQRVSARKNVSYIVYFDAKNHDSKVSIEVRQGNNWRLIDRSNNNDWGESLDEGASRVEFGVSFKDLGLMNLGQTVRMYAASFGPGSSYPSGHDTNPFEQSQGFSDSESSVPDGESEKTADLQDLHHLPWPDDRIPDGGDVQWSPVPVLGYPLLAIVVVGGIFGIWYFKGRHAWRSR